MLQVREEYAFTKGQIPVCGKMTHRSKRTRAGFVLYYRTNIPIVLIEATREGGILCIAARVPRNVKLCLGQRLMLIRPEAEVRSDFLEVALNSPFITDVAKACTRGGAAPRFNMSAVRAYPIPLPPLAEQHRIVAKVDALMAICDRLEASRTAAAATRRRLLDALLAKALEPAADRLLEAAE